MIIRNYAIFKHCIEFYGCGSVTTITNPEEIKTIKSWIKESKKWARNKSDIINYINYQYKYEYEG